MALSDQMLKSRPCKVIFAGWESTTTRLQQSGWSLAVEHSWANDRVRLAMRFRDGGMYMLAEARHYAQPLHYAADVYQEGGLKMPVFQVIHVAHDITVSIIADTFKFEPVDARPQMHTINTTSRPMDAFEIFAVPLVKTEEVIVDPATVSDLMERIKQLQAPELATIRERQRRAERGEPLQQTRYHAQIISLAA
jgi:hypothetical protein